MPKSDKSGIWCGSNLPSSGTPARADAYTGLAGPKARKPFRFTLFLPGGKLNRLKYFYVLAMYWIAYPLCTSGMTVMPSGYWGGWAVFALMAFLLLNAAILIISAIKRFHDLNEPGVNVLFLFVPFYNIYIGIKLLFFESVAGINSYGERDGNGHYWQAPLVMLLAPLLAFGGLLWGALYPSYPASVGNRSAYSPGCLSTPYSAPTPAKPNHYYNDTYQVSVDYPSTFFGGISLDFLLSTSNIRGSQVFTLECREHDSLSFSEYTEYDFTQLKDAYRDKYEFADMMDFGSYEIASDEITANDRYINGYRFLHFSFDHLIEGDIYWHHYIMANYDSKLIVIQIIVYSGDGSAALDKLLACADTFRFGEDAVP